MTTPTFSGAAVEAAIEASIDAKTRWAIHPRKEATSGIKHYEIINFPSWDAEPVVAAVRVDVYEAQLTFERLRDQAAMRAALEAAMSRALNGWPTDAMIAAGVAAYENADPTEPSDSAMRMAWASMMKAAEFE